VFGEDPCSGVPKSFSVEFTCSQPDTVHVCATVEEGNDANIACPAGYTISDVTFASFGTPSGTCGNFVHGSCDASDSVAISSEVCLGHSNCVI
jgi:hypothetical protein